MRSKKVPNLWKKRIRERGMLYVPIHGIKEKRNLSGGGYKWVKATKFVPDADGGWFSSFKVFSTVNAGSAGWAAEDILRELPI
jgi:hypothetical protein